MQTCCIALYASLLILLLLIFIQDTHVTDVFFSGILWHHITLHNTRLHALHYTCKSTVGWVLIKSRMFLTLTIGSSWPTWSQRQNAEDTIHLSNRYIQVVWLHDDFYGFYVHCCLLVMRTDHVKSRQITSDHVSSRQLNCLCLITYLKSFNKSLNFSCIKEINIFVAVVSYTACKCTDDVTMWSKHDVIMWSKHDFSRLLGHVCSYSTPLWTGYGKMQSIRGARSCISNLCYNFC